MQPLRRVAAVAAGVLLGVGIWPLATPAQAAESATVTILHALPGESVDVYVDGNALLRDFRPGRLTDPLTLPAGSHDIRLLRTGAAAGAPALVESAAIEAAAGDNLTVVAHADAAGSPELTPYRNDVVAVPSGRALLTARHVAQTGAVDVRVGGKLVFRSLATGAEKTSVSDAGALDADVVQAGSLRILAGPADLPLRAGTSTIVYAWGSTGTGVQLAVQTIDDLTAAPAEAPGIPGVAAPTGDPVLVVLLIVGVVGAVGATAGVRRSRIPAWLDSTDVRW